MKTNKIDIMLEHFIVHFSAYNGSLMTGGASSLTVMTIVIQILNTAKNPAKCTINKSCNHVLSFCYN